MPTVLTHLPIWTYHLITLLLCAILYCYLYNEENESSLHRRELMRSDDAVRKQQRSFKAICKIRKKIFKFSNNILTEEVKLFSYFIKGNAGSCTYMSDERQKKELFYSCHWDHTNGLCSRIRNKCCTHENHKPTSYKHYKGIISLHSLYNITAIQVKSNSIFSFLICFIFRII